MGNRETQKTLGTRHRKHWAQDTERGQTKQQTQHRILKNHVSTFINMKTKNVILTIYVLHLQNQPLYSVKHLY
jgi:hypothetical protein